MAFHKALSSSPRKRKGSEEGFLAMEEKCKVPPNQLLQAVKYSYSIASPVPYTVLLHCLTVD